MTRNPASHCTLLVGWRCLSFFCQARACNRIVEELISVISISFLPPSPTNFGTVRLIIVFPHLAPPPTGRAASAVGAARSPPPGALQLVPTQSHRSSGSNSVAMVVRGVASLLLAACVSGASAGAVVNGVQPRYGSELGGTYFTGELPTRRVDSMGGTLGHRSGGSAFAESLARAPHSSASSTFPTASPPFHWTRVRAHARDRPLDPHRPPPLLQYGVLDSTAAVSRARRRSLSA